MTDTQTLQTDAGVVLAQTPSGGGAGALYTVTGPHPADAFTGPLLVEARVRFHEAVARTREPPPR